MGEGIVVEDDLGVDVLVGGLEIERAGCFEEEGRGEAGSTGWDFS